ncbi:hypothetical protein KIN20_025901 [Parelaphostrongylus tenuis]|uniref:Uncharacterized protein n=1 Tax=Parelaphostrongylus tenuis TaxID=148309 RepID=A0AAD5MVX3_PARTN|nr:hypothetical protein KIN20_025901 [Parelaphostrongylus tenuis]
MTTSRVVHYFLNCAQLVQPTVIIDTSPGRGIVYSRQKRQTTSNEYSALLVRHDFFTIETLAIIRSLEPLASKGPRWQVDRLRRKSRAVLPPVTLNFF